jgi:GNAT superfamily N-acetyltransferase
VGARARTLGAGASSTTGPYERTRGKHVVSTDPARIDFAFVHRFLATESYWARGVPEAAQHVAMSQSLCFGLYRAGEQVGFARVVTDFGRIAYLADVFVAAGTRRAGLGKWLVECVLAHPDLAAVPRWLLGTADAHGLYARYGFVVAENGRYMVRAV